MNKVYADYAAATPTDPRVVEAMMPYFTDFFGNPSSSHSFGRKTAEAFNSSKKSVAKLINANPEELFFTSSGTESNNLAILGVAKANKGKGNHIITSKIEHPSVLNTCRALERDGYEVTYLPVDEIGQFSLNELTKAIADQTILVTTHFGNSEMGTLQNIKEIGQICKGNNVLFHVDACQSVSYLSVDVQVNNISLLTLNGSKMFGPKGTGILFVRDGIEIFPIIYGGGQQKSLRSGTENVPGAVGLAKAAEIIMASREADTGKVKNMRDELQAELIKIPGVVLNVAENRLPNHLSIRLENRTNADLVREMDELGVAVSAGSACSSSSIVDSHVLRAIGLSSSQAQATLRITLGRTTTKAELTSIIMAVKTVSSS